MKKQILKTPKPVIVRNKSKSSEPSRNRSKTPKPVIVRNGSRSSEPDRRRRRMLDV